MAQTVTKTELNELREIVGDLGLEIEDRLIRLYLPTENKGQYLQVNTYGWSKKNGKKTLILGEAKTSIFRREISRFREIVKKRYN